ncbi:MAG: flippase-like domain-containing protein [Nitrospirae bacterium]|nr:flippase-like domain-containing protein [Nitrospirota bacterium]
MKRVIQTGLGFALAAGLLGYMFKSTDAASHMIPMLKKAGKTELVLACALLLVANLVRALRWRVFVAQPVSRLTAFAGVCAGYVVNNVLPRGGELFRIWYVGRAAGLPLAGVTATVGVERLLDVVALGILFFAALLWAPTEKVEGLGVVTRYGAIAMVTGFVLLGALVVGLAVRGRRRAQAQQTQPAEGASRLARVLHSMEQALSFMRSPRAWARTVAWTVPLWSLYFLMLVLGLESFGLFQSIGWRGTFLIFTITALSTLIPTPGSAGGYHVLGMIVMDRLYGIDRSEAAAFITDFHMLTYYVVNGLLAGLVWGADVWWRRRLAKKSVDQPGRLGIP